MSQKKHLLSLFSGLAVWDALFCLSVIAIRGLSSFGIDSITYFTSLLIPISAPLAFISWTGSVYTTVFLSFELYLIACHQKYLSFKKSCIAMGSIALFSVLVSLPIFWLNAWETNSDGITKTVFNEDLNCNKIFFLLSFILPNIIVRFLIPTTLLCIASILTIQKVKESAKALEKMTVMKVSRKSENQLVKKIISIICVLFCCNITIAILSLTVRLYDSKKEAIIFHSVADLCATLNSCFNMIIYGIFDKKFREIFHSLCFSCLLRKTNKRKKSDVVTNLTMQ